jgi:hypothetical protein
VPSAVQMELKMALAVCVTLRRRNRSMGSEPLAERPLSSDAYVSNGSIAPLKDRFRVDLLAAALGRTRELFYGIDANPRDASRSPSSVTWTLYGATTRTSSHMALCACCAAI